jgi:hypothetical protein
MAGSVDFRIDSDLGPITHRQFKIPYALIEVVATERLYQPFGLLLFLKAKSRGCLKSRSQTLSEAATYFNKHERTIRRYVRILEKRNWIGRYDNGGYILRGFDKICGIEKIPRSKACVFTVKEHLPNTRAFIVGACIGHLSKGQKDKLWRERSKEGKKGISHEIDQTLPTHFNVASRGIAKIFGVSVGTATNWKKEAKRQQYIDIVHTLRPLPEGINGMEWKRAFPEFAHLLRIRGDKYFIQYPDKIGSKLTFCKRHSIKKTDKK